ncbi:DUF6042 family protein [Actinophytocola sp. NPDC049390]|uniref:DUF6042 family protein n=1 Tax=Actinophytocola sp. NPDC049390 TaxID=3363894 RepID=UPI0037B2E533
MDIPYRSLSGEDRLDYTTGGSGADVLPLAGADAYRVRVTRRPVGEDAWGDRWLLRFWRAEPVPPRWWKRRDIAVRAADPGWLSMFSFEFGDLLRAVDGAREDLGEATLESLRRFGVQWHRGADWLDRPLSARVPVLMHPSDVARQLGMPEPGTLAETLDVFVAVGALVEDEGGYRTPATARYPEDVLDMSARDGDRLVSQRDNDRFAAYAADLVAVALWHGTTQTLTDLAERTLVPADDVRAALEWAVRRRFLRVDGSLDATFTMTL